MMYNTVIGHSIPFKAIQLSLEPSVTEQSHYDTDYSPCVVYYIPMNYLFFNWKFTTHSPSPLSSIPPCPPFRQLLVYSLYLWVCFCRFPINVKSYSICLTYLAWCPLGSSMLSEVARFLLFFMANVSLSVLCLYPIVCRLVPSLLPCLGYCK